MRKDLGEKIMNNIEIKQITKIDNDTLDIITKWMYNWWGKEDGYVFEEVKCFMEHSLQENRLPQTYGIFVDSKIVGMYQFAYEDLSIRPDIYPWLANVYIDEAYRNNGFCRKMMETVKEKAKKNLDFNEIYLYTKHQGLYEKFGWKYVSDFDTYRKSPRIPGLYKLELN